MTRYRRGPMRITSYSQYSGATRVITCSRVLTIILQESGTYKAKSRDCSERRAILCALVGINLILSSPLVAMRPTYWYGTPPTYQKSPYIFFSSLARSLILRGKMIVNWQQRVSLKYICGALNRLSNLSRYGRVT